MSKAEKFIKGCTRNCSNEILSPYPQINKDVRKIDGEPAKEFSPWLTPDQARKAVEIAKEEIIERACDAYCKVCGHYAHKTPTYICRRACDYYEDFKYSMKDE